ncbi:MAG TPA: ABC transporter ATP-binding protein [Acidimicrobiales bacterium]|nr:ABC transporter ATP-binding protein [Acidimicrobiales bacterium]
MGWIEASAMDEADRLDREAAKQVLGRALRFLRPYRAEVVLGFVVMAAATACLVAPPLVFAYVVDRVARALRHPAARHGALAYVDHMALVLVALAVAAWLLSRAQIILVTRVGERFLRDIRTRAFEHLLGMSLGFFDSEQTGRLVARLTSDIDTMEDLVQQGLVVFVTNALIFAFTLTAMAVRSWELTLVCTIVVPGVVAASVWFRRVSNRAYLHVRDTVSETLSSLQEGLSGVRVVQAFTREESVVLRFGEHNRAQRDANLRATRLACLYFPVVEGSGVLTMAVASGIGGLLVHRGVITIGTVSAFFFWLTGLFEPINQVSQLYNLVQQAGAGLHKLYGLLDTPSPVRERPGAVDLPMSGEIELDHVVFSYSPALPPVLRDVSLRVPVGERLALVGPTGAGKSTLAKLVARFYDPVEGSVRFGGTDVRDATLSSLRERIVVVPQEGHLFGGTIADNVRLGRPAATDDEVVGALRALGAAERFADLGMEVSERGSQLSAGERQLISLARAFLADPRVLILDEATSSLDPGTEYDVERAVEALMEGRTVIVIAHRLSTAERADRVAVVDDGGVAEVGSHADLVERGGRYAALFASWIGAAPR